MKMLKIKVNGYNYTYNDLVELQIRADINSVAVIYRNEKNETFVDYFSFDKVEKCDVIEPPKHTIQELIPLIQEWFVQRGIDKGDGDGQIEKLKEEVQELVDAHEVGNELEIRDAVGDIIVVLIGYCMQTYNDLGRCLDGAYNEIKDRTGKVNEDGVFVKDTK